jgi:RNA 2',3'-cyclic 3'-phosphodiesterase
MPPRDRDDPQTTQADALMRVFVALWPERDVAERLYRLGLDLHALHVRARLMRATQLHLTLAFIGELPDERLEPLAAQLAALQHTRSVWTIDRLGCFPRARVIWAGGENTAPLQALSQQVRDLLDAQDVRFDRKAFAPHVTLLRDADTLRAAPEFEPILWSLDRARLVVSERDEHGALVYRPLP